MSVIARARRALADAIARLLARWQRRRKAWERTTDEPRRPAPYSRPANFALGPRPRRRRRCQPCCRRRVCRPKWRCRRRGTIG
jgi:hypothetical protein